MMADYLNHLHMVPEHMHGAIQRYIEKGIMPGGFLTAVLSNDLSEAFGRADLQNREAMFEWVQFLYNFCPTGCWGSLEKVESWNRQGGLAGMLKESYNDNL